MIADKEPSCTKAVSSSDDLVQTKPEMNKTNIALAVGSRFGTTLSKEDLKDVKEFLDFFTWNVNLDIVSYKSMTVNIIDDNGKPIRSISGNSEKLNKEQLELLQSIDYSTNLMVRADFIEKNEETGNLEDGYSTPHITIVPETLASYADGWDEIIFYLRAHTKTEAVLVNESLLEPGKLYFTIAKDGSVTNVYVGSSSGYPALDTKMINLINNMPAPWKPAKDANGETVEQKLVISFGNVGC